MTPASGPSSVPPRRTTSENPKDVAAGTRRSSGLGEDSPPPASGTPHPPPASALPPRRIHGRERHAIFPSCLPMISIDDPTATGRQATAPRGVSLFFGLLGPRSAAHRPDARVRAPIRGRPSAGRIPPTPASESRREEVHRRGCGLDLAVGAACGSRAGRNDGSLASGGGRGRGGERRLPRPEHRGDHHRHNPQRRPETQRDRFRDQRRGGVRRSCGLALDPLPDGYGGSRLPHRSGGLSEVFHPRRGTAGLGHPRPALRRRGGRPRGRVGVLLDRPPDAGRRRLRASRKATRRLGPAVRPPCAAMPAPGRARG